MSTDPEIIFNLVWDKLERERGVTGMRFPKELVFFCGAPGAGKGTMAGHIMAERDFTAGPIEVSGLLKHPKFTAMKDAGKLVGDKDVMEVMLMELLDPAFAEGVVVDGFPRTAVQATMIRLLYDKMRAVRFANKDNPALNELFPRPMFHIAVLWVDEDESVKRQLSRGEQLEKYNKRVAASGVGKKMQARATDTDVELARHRYQVFTEEVSQALEEIRDVFHFHFIDANGPPEEVAERVKAEFTYQSGMELSNETFELVRHVTPAHEIIRHARQRMVQRLNAYSSEHTELFKQVLTLINQDFVHILQRQALAGKAIIRSNSPLLESKICINMVLDVLAERGYNVTLDITRERFAERLEPAVPGDMSGQRVHNQIIKTWIFEVTFRRPQIRRAED